MRELILPSAIRNRVKDKVVSRIGFVADSLPLTVTTQESATKPIFKTTLVKDA